jgi:hypothetical protein
MRLVALVGLLFVTAGCGESRQIVPLIATSGVPVSEPVTVPLEIVTRSTAVADPLPVRGTDVSYADIEAALGHAVATATVPWADRHREHASAPGWQLTVELTSADAEYDAGRAVFTLGVRATLRAREGNVYLAQTQAACRQGGVVPPDGGASVMDRCMNEVGHQLANWLDGVDLDAVARPRRG